ncbi:TPA_asm: hypothetical protein, partial [ssRNA phage SRR6960549_3]
QCASNEITHSRTTGHNIGKLRYYRVKGYVFHIDKYRYISMYELRVDKPQPRLASANRVRYLVTTLVQS